MKRCPECRRDYYDDSLLYCLDDGTALLEGPGSGSEPATALLAAKVSGEARTRRFAGEAAVNSNGAAISSENVGALLRRHKVVTIIGGILIAVVVGGFC